MAEPVTLYNGEEEFTTHAPSEVIRLQGEGWKLNRPAPTESGGRGKGEAEKPAKPAPATKRRRKTAASEK